MFQLVSRSKKPEAEKIWIWLTGEVMPTLMRTRTYTMPATESDIERLNKSFYDENMLSDYENNPVVYLAYA
jgi:prophage antirepressor-like protein